MVAVLQDREAKSELPGERTRRGQGIDAHGDDAAPETPDLCEIVLQLDELRLTRPSPRAFVEVDNDL